MNDPFQCFFDDDPNFVKSFEIPFISEEEIVQCLDNEANLTSILYCNEDLALLREFFEKHGFVVFRDVFSSAECNSTLDEIFSSAEVSSEFRRNDPSTYCHLKSNGKYGLCSRGPSFLPTLIQNRQNPRLAVALASILDSPLKDVMISHDRYSVYRPTVSIADHYDSSLSTGPRNVHLDLNPWWWLTSSDLISGGLQSLTYKDQQDFIRENNLVVKSMGRHVQCVVNLIDNYNEDGGTIVVPGFHRMLPHWCAENEFLQFPFPWVNFDSGLKPESSGALEAKRVHNELLAHSLRITMRQGSVLIWDQTVMHGTTPNTSKNFRVAQYLKAFRRSKTFPTINDSSDDLVYSVNKRLAYRSKSLKAIMQPLLLQHRIKLTSLGISLFGLDVNSIDDS